MHPPRFLALTGYREYPDDEMLARATQFAADAARRRSIRQFSDRPVARATIEQCLRAAGTAPSGANQQPWRFVAVADAARKCRIRSAAEAEEREFRRKREEEEGQKASALAQMEAAGSCPMRGVSLGRYWFEMHSPTHRTGERGRAGPGHALR